MYGNQKVTERLGYRTEPLYICGVMFLLLRFNRGSYVVVAVKWSSPLAQGLLSLLRRCS